MPESLLRRKVTRFATHGMRSLFDPEPTAEPEAADRRVLPLGIRRAIVELTVEYPPFGLREIARICRERFGHPAI